MITYLEGGEEGRPPPSGWIAADPLRRRNSGPVTGTAKQKPPVTNDHAIAKERIVSTY